MKTLLSKSPLYAPSQTLGVKATKDKGEQIMEGLLLDQYTNSPLLKEYFMAFIAELDFLFEQVEEVYFGRFIDRAIGFQLDVIGEVLQQSRSVILPTVWFGFQGATDVDGMADEATPAYGGLFKDENIGEGTLTALDDTLYRRMLLAKAILLNRDSMDISLAYYVISILLNRVPSTFELRDGDSGIPAIRDRQVDLLISRSAITEQETGLLLYMTKYFVPAGVTFTITKV